MAKARPVHIIVHPLYFDKMFEPQRKKLERKMKIPLSQIRYTEIVARKSLGIKFPKNMFRVNKRRFRGLKI